jgi:DnaJ-class molecular chaperone
MNLNKKADKKTIKNMYHKLCFEYHPDKASGMHQEKFKMINDAYQVLGDEKIRKSYDEAREDYAEYE